MSIAALLLKLNELGRTFESVQVCFQPTLTCVLGLHLFRIRRHMYKGCICKKHKQYLSIFGPWGLSIQECGRSLWHIQTSVAYKIQLRHAFLLVYSLPWLLHSIPLVDISSLVVFQQHRWHTCDIETKRGQLLSLCVLQDLLKSTILEKVRQQRCLIEPWYMIISGYKL